MPLGHAAWMPGWGGNVATTATAQANNCQPILLSIRLSATCHLPPATYLLCSLPPPNSLLPPSLATHEYRWCVQLLHVYSASRVRCPLTTDLALHTPTFLPPFLTHPPTTLSTTLGYAGNLTTSIEQLPGAGHVIALLVSFFFFLIPLFFFVAIMRKWCCLIGIGFIAALWKGFTSLGTAFHSFACVAKGLSILILIII